MSLKEELEMEQVRHLDLSRYCMVESGTSVRETLGRMRAEAGRSALVIRDGGLLGIFTERDVLNRVAGAPETLDGPVDAVMTRGPITVSPDTSAASALWLMDDHHFRNLPVVDDDGRILGDMTYGAIIQYLAARYPVEVLNRPARPEQYPSKAEGGD
ncbi:CBS domain-containing protein [Promineifilum sp.]|uniref:CBS domain-containing protein n=1 Tax=Promineifilum sp. TaxID=2664178 RepID=UPI0035B1B678